MISFWKKGEWGLILQYLYRSPVLRYGHGHISEEGIRQDEVVELPVFCLACPVQYSMPKYRHLCSTRLQVTIRVMYDLTTSTNVTWKSKEKRMWNFTKGGLCFRIFVALMLIYSLQNLSHNIILLSQTMIECLLREKEFCQLSMSTCWLGVLYTVF